MSEVQTRKKNEISANMFETDAGQGIANITQEDLALPFLKVLGQLSPHSGSAAPSDRFQKAGAEMLSKSKTAQFFDRDTTPEMAKAAMQLMVDFMLEPESMMEILEEIELICNENPFPCP